MWKSNFHNCKKRTNFPHANCVFRLVVWLLWIMTHDVKCELLEFV